MPCEIQDESDTEAHHVGQRVCSAGTASRPIRVIAMIEATSVTGPAKNTIAFATRAAKREVGALNLSIVAFVRGDERRNSFVAAARTAGVAVDVIHERFVFDPGIISQLHKIVEARQPEIIQTHAVKSHFLLWLTQLHRRCRWIAFNRGYTRENLKVRGYNQLDRISLPRADQVVTVCEAFARDLQRVGVRRERIAVHHNMVLPFTPCSAEESERVRKMWALSPEELVLLSVGRLSPEKGHSDLIDAINVLRKMPVSRRFRLMIVGGGPEQEAIRRKIEHFGLAGLVTLAGQQHDIRPYYAVATVMVLPSHSEGSPNVLLEAMAAGVPAVATNVGGIPEIVTNEETALLIEPKKPCAMAKAIFRLLQDEPLSQRLSKAAAISALRYDPEHYCDYMVGLHRSVLHRQS